MMHHSLYARDICLFRYILSKAVGKAEKIGKDGGGVWSAARETMAPHQCIHIYVFMYTGVTYGNSYVYRRRKYESEKSV